MQDDFLRGLGYLALASRLKRISDRMIHSGREMYKNLEIDVEPNWYLVLLLLKDQGILSITDISSRLGFAHTSVMAMVNRMVSNGYVRAFKSDEDARKQMLELTDKAKSKMPELEQIWEAGTVGISEIFHHSNELLDMLDKLEDGLTQANFKNRTLNKMTQNEK